MTKCEARCLALSILMIVPILTGSSCFPSGPNGGTPPPPPGGFAVNIQDITSTGVVLQIHSGGQISGTWAKDDTGAVGGVYSFPLENQPYTVVGGREPAAWNGEWVTNGFCTNGQPFGWGPDTIPAAGYVLTVGQCVFGSGFLQSSDYVQTGSLPSTLTIQGSGFSSTYGMPQLTVFNQANKSFNLVSQTLATSVGSGGTSATFNFPTDKGAALTSGVYTFSTQNQTSPGVFSTVGGNFISVGTGSTSYPSALGIDVGDEEEVTHGIVGNITTSPPVVVLSASGKLAYNGSQATVGASPTAVKIVGNTEDGQGEGEYLLVPGEAVVTNYGTNTVSVVGLRNMNIMYTIVVGSQPISVAAILPVGEIATAATAYVANYGSGTVSVVNLTNGTVSNTVSVGNSPATITMDPGGAAFWVGGLDYIKKISTSNFATLASYTVSGQVTSLAIAAGMNDYVYTLLNGSTFEADHASISGGGAHVDYQHNVDGAKMMKPLSDTPGAPPTWVQANGPIVSSSNGNRYVVEGTPTGFIVVDLETGTVMLQGPTSSEVTAIATDPLQSIAYLTAQASNSVISVPLPPQD